MAEERDLGDTTRRLGHCHKGAGREPDAGAETRVRIVIRPNRSLPPRAIYALFAAFAAVAATIALGFWLVGAWLVMPFAGLEIVVAAAVFRWLYLHSDDHELVEISGDDVSIVKRAGGKESCVRFQRYWTRVSLIHTEDGRYPSRLLVGSHGHFVQLGANVVEQEREALARHLKHAVGRSQ